MRQILGPPEYQWYDAVCDEEVLVPARMLRFSWLRNSFEYGEEQAQISVMSMPKILFFASPLSEVDDEMRVPRNTQRFW